MKQHLPVVVTVLLAVTVEPGDFVALGIHKRGAWHHPCGRSVSTDGDNANRVDPPRHEVTKLLRAVKTQLGIATKYFKTEQKNINITYAQVGELTEDMFRFDWLPQKQIHWFKNDIVKKCLKRPAKLEKVLQTLHSALQNFAVTFQELQKFGKPNIFSERVSRIRNRVIDGLSQHLNQVLCEVDSTLIMLGIPRPPQVADDFLNSKEWNRNPDNTSLLIQDWGVLSICRNFLVDWFHIMERVNKNTGCRTGADGGRRRKKPKT